MKGVTYNEYVGDGYYVSIVFCEGCSKYLGVNYPSYFCKRCAKELGL